MISRRLVSRLVVSVSMTALWRAVIVLLSAMSALGLALPRVISMKTDGEMRRVLRARPERAGLIRPGIEALERRELLAALGPAVVLDSVSTLDSHGVTIEYDVLNADLGQPFELGVYRSSDDRFDSADLTVQTLTVGGPGTTAVDDSGVSPLARGTTGSRSRCLMGFRPPLRIRTCSRLLTRRGPRAGAPRARTRSRSGSIRSGC